MTTWAVPLADLAAADASLDRRRLIVAVMRHDYHDVDGVWRSAKIADPYPIDVFETTFDTVGAAFVPVLDVWHPNSGRDLLDWIESWREVELADLHQRSLTIRRSVRFVSLGEDLVHPRLGVRRNRDNDAYWPCSSLLAEALRTENILHIAARARISPDALRAICEGRFIHHGEACEPLASGLGMSAREIADDFAVHDPHRVFCTGERTD